MVLGLKWNVVLYLALAMFTAGCTTTVISEAGTVDEIIARSWKDTKGFSARFRQVAPFADNDEDTSIALGTVSFRGTSSTFEYRIDGESEMSSNLWHFEDHFVFAVDGTYGYVVRKRLVSEPPRPPESDFVLRVPISVSLPGIDEFPVHPTLSLRIQNDMPGKIVIEEVRLAEHGRVYLLTFPARIGAKSGQIRLYFSKSNGVPLRQELLVKYGEEEPFKVFEIIEYMEIVINPEMPESEFIFEIPSDHHLKDYQNGEYVEVEKFSK